MAMLYEEGDGAPDAVTVKQPETPITIQLLTLDEKLSYLDNNLRRLVNRLQPVLGPNRPDTPDESMRDIEGSDIARWLAAKNQFVEELNSTVMDLIERLEV